MNNLTNDTNSSTMRRGKLSPPQKLNGWTEENKSAPQVENGAADDENDSSPSKPVPGRPRRRHSLNPLAPPKKKKKRASFWTRFHAKWIAGYSSLILAVLLWYNLGVISISISKLLLMNPEHGHVGNVPPLFLTLQQLCIGKTLLRYLLRIRAFGSAGLQPFPSNPPLATSHRSRKNKPRTFWKSHKTDLIMAGVYFTLGFLTTNLSFQRSNTAYVETIKAAEPISSAAIAVLWGIETLSPPEVSSLAAIVAGVLLSTMGNSTAQAQTGSAMTMAESIKSCLVVLASNFCFSFRGLHQKLFRASSQGGAALIDDLNLQFRMQQIGVYVLLLPVLVLNAPGMIASVWELSSTVGLIKSGILLRYTSLALLNGMAFACYNLASTFILTRISVVHHAALNCIRRVFAIVVTSFLFRVPITFTGVCGILISIAGFLSFTHYKTKRLRQPKPVSSLLPVSEHDKNGDS
jgi:drug/metabolite transporter (DMT)-like permease